VKIIDNQGLVLYEESNSNYFESSKMVDLSSFKSGLYLLQLFNNKGVVFSGKIVKQ